MYSILKICGASLISVVLSAVLKNRSSSLSPYLSEITSVLILISVISSLSPVVSFFKNLTIGSESGEILLKTVMNSAGSAILCGTVCDICKENGENTLSSVVELAGNCSIIIASVPILTSVLENIYSVIGI